MSWRCGRHFCVGCVEMTGGRGSGLYRDGESWAKGGMGYT